MKEAYFTCYMASVRTHQKNQSYIKEGHPFWLDQS